MGDSVNVVVVRPQPVRPFWRTVVGRFAGAGLTGLVRGGEALVAFGFFGTAVTLRGMAEIP
jgi:hypothetical protein